MKPKVSIITVTYNCELLIEETLLSSMGQTYDNKEIIVIDGMSTDGTLSIIRRHESQIDLFISEKDDGIFDAMNKGIERASGEWIIFMNSGDLFVSKNTLSELTELLTNLKCAVIYAPHILRFRKHERLVVDIPFFNQEGRYRTMGFSHQSCLVRVSLAQKYLFKRGLSFAADFHMLWRIYYEEKALFLRSCEPIAIMDDNAGATVSNYKRHLVEECEISGYGRSYLRTIFVEKEFLYYKVKRLLKRLLY